MSHDQVCSVGRLQVPLEVVDARHGQSMTWTHAAARLTIAPSRKDSTTIYVHRGDDLLWKRCRRKSLNGLWLVP